MLNRLLATTLCSFVLALASCGPTPQTPMPEPTDLPPQQASTSSRIKYVFVIAMENHADSQIYGSPSAPYINGTLMASYGFATRFLDDLPSLPSEPHYVWMEAGTNAFSDHTFTTNSEPSSSNSTGSTEHLSTQIRNATHGVSWLSYQEDIDDSTGACPIAASGFYAPKHDPFVFFRDVAGNPPSKTNSYCARHHRPFTSLANDLATRNVATYNFITPNLCHDMHGATGCPDSDTVHAGDAWLQENLPPIISFVNANNGVIFIVWDEPETSGTMPFLVIGPEVKPHFAHDVELSHSSLVKSLEQILDLPLLPTVSEANDFSGFFNEGMYP